MDDDRDRGEKEGDTETAMVQNIARPSASTGVGPSGAASISYHSCELLNNTPDKGRMSAGGVECITGEEEEEQHGETRERTKAAQRAYLKRRRDPR